MSSHSFPRPKEAVGYVDLLVLGVRIHIAGTDMEFEEAMSDLLDPDPSEPNVHLRIAPWGETLALLKLDGSPVSICPEGRNPIPHLVSVLNMLALDGDLDRLHVHAALVEVKGIGVMLCGPSGAGKSTLSAALVERGAGYLTDETVALLPGSRTLQSHHKPFIFKGWAISRFAKRHPPGDERTAVRGSLFGRTVDASVCSEIVFPKFVKGAELALIRISPARAAELVVQESLDIRRFGPEALLVIADLVARAACWELTYGDVDQAADAIAAQVGKYAESQPWSLIHLDRRTSTVGLDGAELKLDSVAQLFAWRVGHRPDAVQPTATPSVALGVLEDVINRLTDAGIGTVVAGDAIALIDGPLFELSPPRFGPSLVVTPTELARARSIAREVGGPQLADEVEGLVRIEDSHLLFDLFERSAVQVRLGALWHRGLHPRHRFLLASIQNALDPGSVDGVTINTLGRLPQSMLWEAFEDASRLGMLRELMASVAAAAADAPGVTRALVETYREH